MTGTILVYRNERRRPSAEIRLAGGDHVGLALHADGVMIEGGRPGGARRVLFRGDANTLACICAAMSSVPDLRSTPLDRLLAIVVHFRTAADLADAFTAAAAIH
ncbi:hypothetical protein [Desertibaculum subflavum]|uniref:hypothetical protein n=1 Tax=Desertibaculum subflavum TaxID=2268458 RepID=UPI000E66E100